MNNMQNNDKKKKKEKSVLASISLISQLGISVVTPMIIGIYVGKYLDSKFNKKGLFTLFFVILGLATGIFNIFKLTYPKGKDNGEK